MSKSTAKYGKSGSHQFAQIPSVNVSRSSFNRSHAHTTTFDGGFLIPIEVDELLPGETYKARLSSFVRMLTPLWAPMDQAYLDTHWFFVPNRLLWDNWERFMGYEPNPGDSVDFLVPTLDFSNGTAFPSGQFDTGTVFDYMGLPPFEDYNQIEVNALHFRAMNLIWNEWFRPEDSVDAVTIHTDDGPDPAEDYTLLRRFKRHDYFTAALPFAQKGPEVTLPLGIEAPLVGTPDLNAIADPSFTSGGATDNLFSTSAGADVTHGPDPASGVREDYSWDDHGLEIDLAVPGVYADLQNATAISVNLMRESVTLQQFYEKQARGGTRYTEQITSFFGVKSPDARLQRPEYLHGSSDRLHTTPVTNTAGIGIAQGEISSFVTGGGDGRPFTYSSTEHGVILCFAMIRANLTYQQGLHRMWSRQTRFDFAFPIFATLGEQPVLNKEIYLQGNMDDDDVFGYQERYAEYRYAQNRISGLFRSSDPQSLDTWHYAQDFQNLPELNESFLEEDPPFQRAVAVQDEPIFKGNFYFEVNHVRPLPVFSVPGLQRF